ARRYLEELELFRPDILAACRDALGSSTEDLHFTRINGDAFAACPSDSIDYAVMERTEDAVVVPLEAGWSDVSSWSALWDVGIKDDKGNVFKGDVLAEATRNTYANATNRLVAT